MYLTVPLPIAQYRQMKVQFVPRDSEKPPVRVRLLVPQNASFMQVKEKLGPLVHASSSNVSLSQCWSSCYLRSQMVAFDLWKGGIYAWFHDTDHNSEAKDSDEVAIYEVGAGVSSTRKATGTISNDGSITVPVYTFRSSEHRIASHRPEIPNETCLQPFFITLSKNEATDPAAVREAIAKGYARFIKAEDRSRMWVPSSSKHAHLIHASPVDEDDQVTEIHIDGDTTKILQVPANGPDGGMDIDQSGPPSRALSRSSSVSSLRSEKSATDGPPRHAKPHRPFLSGLRKNSSSASVSSLASNKSLNIRLVPRADLFKVHVADASTSESSSSLIPSLSKANPAVVPLYKQAISAAAAHWSLLESRRRPRKNMFGRFASGITSVMNPGYTSDDDSPPGTPAPQMVVRPGEGIFCEWSNKRYAEYFEGVVQEDDEIVDPQIEKEAAKKKEGRAISIEDCLDEFSKEETLGQDDLWYCPNVSR